MGSNDPSGQRISASKTLLGLLDDTRDYAGVVSWDNNVDFTFPLSQDFAAVSAALDRVDSSGLTNLNVGLFSANFLLDNAISMLDGDPRSSNKVIIFLTDGQGTYTPCASNGPAASARDKGYIIYSILLGSNTGSEAGLIDMADCTGGEYFTSPSAANLQLIFDAVLDRVSSSSVPKNIDVSLEIDPCVNVNSGSIVPAGFTTSGNTLIEWNDIDGGNGLSDGQSIALQSCGTIIPECTSELDIIQDVVIEFENNNGTPQPSLTPDLTSPIPVNQGEHGGNGDPHFLRWHHTKRDSFQGECDLVLIHADDFGDTLGLDVHLRTTIDQDMPFFSYIEAVAMRVGDYVIEFTHDAFLVDGTEYSYEQRPLVLPTGVGSENVINIVKDPMEKKKKRRTLVQVSDSAYVRVISSSRYMSAAIKGSENDLVASEGLLGDFRTGNMVGRKGEVFDNYNLYGFEWQVNPDHDRVLFSNVRAPQLSDNQKCRMPTMTRKEYTASKHGILRGMKAGVHDKAVKACRRAAGNFALCMEDVMATGDLDLAQTFYID